MCSISGYIALGDKRPNKENIGEMFVAGESRGTDASGIAFINDNNKLEVFKDAVSASAFIKSTTWQELTMPKIMVLHTRAATQGVPQINDNNHPITNADVTKALVHNGIITNEDDFGVPRNEVDSKAIMLAYEKYANKQEMYTNLKGSYAVALLDETTPDTLTLWKHTNPLELMFDIKNKIIYFASTEIMLKKNKTNKGEFFGFEIDNDYVFQTFPDNHYAVITPEGLTTFEKYEPPTYQLQTYTPSHYSSKRYDSGYGYGYGYPKNYKKEYYDDDYGFEKDWLPTPPKKTVKDSSDEEMIKDINLDLQGSNYLMVLCHSCKNPVIIDKTKPTQLCDWCSTKIILKD